MGKVTIKVIRAFYRNDKICTVGSVVKDMPSFEANGYIANKKAVLVDAPKAEQSKTEPPKPEHTRSEPHKPSDDRKKEEKKT